MLLSLAAAASPPAQSRWVGAWTAAQQAVEPANSIPPADLSQVTLRQVVRLSIGGDRLRVRLSNRFGVMPVHFASVHIARPLAADSSAIRPDTDTTLTFSGRPEATIPAGAEYLSDPVRFPAPALSDLVITFYMEAVPASQTGHPGSRATSYLVHGNRVSAPDLPDAQKIEHWYFISSVEIATTAALRAMVVLGDSITDGYGTTTNQNNRWTDTLAKRLKDVARTRDVAVLNQGIGGNRVLLDGLGPNALARFDADVLAPAGVRYLMVMEGINDLGMATRDAELSQAEHDALVRRILAAYEQIVTRAHAHGIKVIGATLTPFVGSDYYHPDAQTEADRKALNQWIRMPGHFDAVIDFDQLLRDPEHPDRLWPRFDSGDHLHPSLAGYAAMGEALPLSLFWAQ